MSETQTTRTLRAMAFERARGELRSMLPTYHSSEDTWTSGRCDAMEKLINTFEDAVTSQGLNE